jgi:hypothetical protein
LQKDEGDFALTAQLNEMGTLKDEKILRNIIAMILIRFKYLPSRFREEYTVVGQNSHRVAP